MGSFVRIDCRALRDKILEGGSGFIRGSVQNDVPKALFSLRGYCARGLGKTGVEDERGDPCIANAIEIFLDRPADVHRH